MSNNFGREWIILIKEKGLEYTTGTELKRRSKEKSG